MEDKDELQHYVHALNKYNTAVAIGLNPCSWDLNNYLPRIMKILWIVIYLPGLIEEKVTVNY